MRISFSESFRTELERIDGVISIDRVKIGSRNYKPEVVCHNGIMQACIIDVVENECERLDFYYNGKLNVSEGLLAFTISSDTAIKLNHERTIFEINLGSNAKAEIRCPWLTEDTKVIEGIGSNSGYSFYKNIEISDDTLIWKESIGKYITDRGLSCDHVYDVERIDTKKGILEERPIKFKSYKNLIIEQGNWKVKSITRTVTQKHDVYSEISSSVFYVWDSPMIDAKVNTSVTPTCIEKFNEYLDPDNIVFGNSDCFQYINFQGGVLRGFRITGTEGSEVEIRFNKTSSNGSYTSFRCKIDSTGITELRIPTDLPYAHLNGIVTVGPSKISKVETIQYIEEPVDIVEPDPDSTYIAEINNVDPSCVVSIDGVCDYIEYEKYLGEIKEIGRGTVHINNIPEIEIELIDDKGLDSTIDNSKRQIICKYNPGTSEDIHYDVFQVKIENNIVVDGNNISMERLNSDYKIRIEQTGIIWKITNSPDYIYVDEDDGKSYGIFLLGSWMLSSRTLEVITNRLDYRDNLVADVSEVSSIFNISSIRIGERVIDGEVWNVYNLRISTRGKNDEEEWIPQRDPDKHDPYVINVYYNNNKIETLSFCPIQVCNVDSKISIWEETFPNQFTKVDDGKLVIFNSVTKNFIVVRKLKSGEGADDDHNWYYYDLDGTNKFYLTDTNSLTTNVGIVFRDSTEEEETVLEVSREKFSRTINVNRSDLINSLGVLTVTESSTYPGSWRDLINNNTANVEVVRELSNIYISVGEGDVLENKDYVLKVNRVGTYTIKVLSNFKYVAEASGYIKFANFNNLPGNLTRTSYSTRKEVFSLYNTEHEFVLALTRLDDEEGLAKSGVIIRSGNVERKITVEIDSLEVTHDYLDYTQVSSINIIDDNSYTYRIGPGSVPVPNIIRIFNNESVTPRNERFIYTSTTTPVAEFSGDIDKVTDNNIPILYRYGFSNYVSDLQVTISNSRALSLSKYPIKSFGSISFNSLSYSDIETGNVVYSFFMKGKEHYLWCVDNISDISNLVDPTVEEEEKNIFIDASGESGRNIYVLSRYSVNNRTFITEYPEESEVKIGRNNLEALIKISPQEKIALDENTQIEYSIPINVSCNISNNGGSIYLGSLEYNAKTVINDSSIPDVIEVSDEIIEKESINKNYIKNYITGGDDKPKQELSIKIFQRGNNASLIPRIFSDVTNFGILGETKYIIPEVGKDINITGISVTTTSIGGLRERCTVSETHNSKYFLVKVDCEDIIKPEERHWFDSVDLGLTNDKQIEIKTKVDYELGETSDSVTFTSKFTRFGCNYGFYIDGDFGFGTVEQDNENGYYNDLYISAEGGYILLNAGVFYAAVDGWDTTEALLVPHKYEFVGMNVPDEVTWENGNADDSGNLCIKIPPRVRDDHGDKEFILHVSQPHEYYPINLYVRIKQRPFSAPDTAKNNYHVKFDREILNVHSNGEVEGGDKIYFTHNLNEELFNSLVFSYNPNITLPKEPDDLSYLEEIERNYKEGYVRFKFKPNGSKQFIVTEIIAKLYNSKTIGTIGVNQGYYSLVLSYRSGEGESDNYITNYISRVSPKSILVEKFTNSETGEVYIKDRCNSPCWKNSDNSDASEAFSMSRDVLMVSAYRKEFYDTEERVYGIPRNGNGNIEDNNDNDNGKFFNVFKEAIMTNVSFRDNFDYISLSFSPKSSDSQYSDHDALVNPLYNFDDEGNETAVKTKTNFSKFAPYLETTYECKKEYIPYTFFFTSVNRITLLDEDYGKQVDYYYSISQYKEASDEIVGPIEFSDLNLHFDCYGGEKEVSFKPARYYDKIDGHIEFVPDCDWASFELLDNAIRVTVDENISEDDDNKKYYRTVQLRVNIGDSEYIYKTIYINVEQDSDLTNSGGGGGGDDPDPPVPSEVNIKLKLVNDRTDKDLELNGEVLIYVDDGEGYHVGIHANVPGYDTSQNNLIIPKGTSSETFSITCTKTENVNPGEYLKNSIDFVHSKEGCKAYTMNGGGHDSDIYKPYKISISGGGITFEQNKTYIITFHEEGAGTAPNLPLMSDFNEVLTTDLNKEKVTLEYAPKTSAYLTSAMNLATSEWNSGSLFNIVNETGIEVINYRGTNSAYEENAKTSMYAWLYAMCLSEIIPSYSSDMTANNQTILYKKAYNLGGGRNIPLYGNFTPKGDCMVARLVAGILWAKNRSKYSFTDLDTMRSEIGGQFIDKPNTAWTDFGFVENTRIGWLVNLDEIFPAAPGPYANGYDNGRTRPSSQGQSPTLFYTPSESQYNWWSDNYRIDVAVDNAVVSGYNLQTSDVNLSRTVQAVADDTEDITHMFGEKTYYKYDATKTTVVDGIPVQGPRFTFTPGTPSDNNGVFFGTFGSEVTGVDLSSILSSGNDDTETDFSYYMGRSRYIGGSGRYPLLYPQYGRRRPSQGLENPSSRDNSNYRLDWLDDNSIARLVGSGTKYDASGQAYNLYWADINGNGKYDVRHLTYEGKWVDAEPFYNDGVTDVDEHLFPVLYANTYPSGHSSGVWGTALCTTLFFPDKYKEIFRAAYKFSVSRTIVRAHWNSDITYGRTIGTMVIPISHANRYNNSRYENYRTLYSKALKQATGGGDDPDVDEALSACYDYCINEADNQDPPRDDLDYLKQTSTNNGRYIVFSITNNTRKYLIWAGRISFFVLDDPNNPTGERTQIYGFYRIYNDTDSQGYHHMLFVNPSNYLIKPGEVIRVKVPMARQYDAVDLEGKRLATTIRSSKGRGDYFRLYVLKTDLDDDYALHADSIALIDQTSYNNPVLTNGAEYNLVMTADLFNQSLADGNKYYLNSESEYNASKSYCLSASGSNYAPMRLSDWS